MHYSFSTTSLNVDTNPELRFQDVVIALVVGGVFGAAFFWLIVPLEVLDPTYFQWLMWLDPMQQFLGWHFFRNEPWQLPLGISHYGMEMGSSIVFTDSIPLLALLFKTAAASLPQKFQYFGIWVLWCFVLQGVFAWLLARCITPRRFAQLLVMLLLTASTVMVQRVIGHFALVGHWLILAALLLYLRPPARATLLWCMLAGIAAWVHAYLSYLVLAVWVASLLQRYHSTEVREALTEIAAVFLSLLAMMWLVGYFALPTSSFSGNLEYYGRYAANLNAFWNPGWGSRLLTERPVFPGSEFEGYAYLGAGGLLLVAMALALLVFSRPARVTAAKHWPLILVALLLWTMAISNQVMLDERVIVKIPLPELVLKWVAMVRASGRLLWVPYYALLLGCAALLLQNTRAWAGATLLLGVVMLQAWDMSPRALGLRTYFQEHYVIQAQARESPLVSPFWEEAAQRYRTVRFVPARHIAPGYGVFALYAADHGMAINVGQFAKWSDSRIDAMNKALSDTLATGVLDKQSLYIFWGDKKEGVFPVRVGRQDRIEVIDGFQVLAPDWYGDSGNDSIRWTRDTRRQDILLPRQ